MFKVCSLVVFAVFTTTAAMAFEMHSNLGLKRKIGYDRWEELPMVQNHGYRQPNQPPRDWTNLTFEIPEHAHGVQLTAYDANGTLSFKDNTHVVTADIPCIGIMYYDVLYVSVVWWYSPWTLYVGWTNQSCSQSRS